MPITSRIPRPRRGATLRSHHGDDVIDPYAWLEDASDPDVLAHLAAENEYATEATAHLDGLRATLFDEIRRRTQESDLSVPVAQGDWWYYARTTQGRQYPTHYRLPREPGGERPVLAAGQSSPREQLLLDGNVEAGESEFLALGGLEIDHAGRRLAFLVDVTGDERFDLRIRDIDTGHVVDDSVRGAGYGIAFSLDGRFVFYTRVDDAWRPHEVWRHEVGGALAEDVLVYREDDERFWLGIGVSRDERHLVIAAGSKQTSDARLLDLAEPTSAPRLVAPRREGVEYDVEPAGAGMFIVHNARHPDFEVAWAPIDECGEGEWQEWLTPAPGERIIGVDAFEGHVVVSLRSDGLTALRVVSADPAEGSSGRGAAWDLSVDEPLYTIGLGSNPEWNASRVLVEVESLVTPPMVAEYDLLTGSRTVVRQRPVPGGYSSEDYVQRREWVRAADGTRVPCSIVHRADVRLDGTAPGLLYGYGAYEICLDPWFSVPRLSLLDRGVVYVIAHVRGGGELGRSWYESGRLDAKMNSFTDLVDVATHLVEAGFVDPARLAVEGGSAGGLLVGAALNLAPQRFRVALAQVPFVDALTTILDPSKPLTVTEWDEWGDPLHDAEAYARMRAYTPYENVQAQRYPAVLATTSLHDTRVSYAEPAKWVARLRDVASNEPNERPILLRTEMSAGHGGRSGRYDAWREYAWENAFLLDQLGATERVDGGSSAATQPAAHDEFEHERDRHALGQEDADEHDEL